MPAANAANAAHAAHAAEAGRGARVLPRPARWLAAALVALAGGTAALAQPVVSRGQLLYQNHCAACHDTQIHWRQNKRATDWSSLVAQVRQWQASEQLNWTEADVLAVARHLNETIYHWPRPEQRAGADGGR